MDIQKWRHLRKLKFHLYAFWHCVSNTGIPDKTNVHERIKELIPDQTSVEVNVTKANADDMEFLIKVPSVYEELKKEGLM